uniref:SEA domain-containing protein n=1 Tax=Anser brachyrhynchus TaxID=132585 RepID=A0A8B9C7R2_9AVES
MQHYTVFWVSHTHKDLFLVSFKIIILLLIHLFTALSITTVQSPTLGHFTLNFTLTNLQYTADLDAPSSRKFISTEKAINHYIDPLFKRSSISSVYTGCKVMRFRPVHGKAYVSVDSVCKFTLEPFSRTLQKQEVYEELKHLTHGFTKLGPSYELEEQSLVVEGKCSRDDFVGTSATFVLITSEVPCFSTIVSCLRRKSQLYQVQQGMYGGFFPHLNTRKVH